MDVMTAPRIGIGLDAGDRERGCECLHDPEDADLQDWDAGVPCGEPATARVICSCDCGGGCPNRVYLMCRDCVDGAYEHGDVVTVLPL